ncbi:MAG: alpha/beta hydrolase [Verrucomicrobiota bacterium]|nr:alpha/beta hydrolase [Verrucomicrobiota bacterium]
MKVNARGWRCRDGRGYSSAMEVRGAIVRLGDGSHVAYDEYGDPRGFPVIFCHGWPSSRSMAQLTDDAAKRLGVRIISPDRPGIRGSSFVNARTLLDWPDVLSAFVAHLSIKKFRMLAISGGAPYAYVAGWKLPDKVEAIAIASGVPPISELTDHAGLFWLHRRMLALQGRNPKLLRALFRIARPIASLQMSLRCRPFLRLILQRMDAEALRDRRAFESCFESSRAAWAASVDGVIADAEIYAQPWGFPVEEVRVPIHLWHGKNDRTFSFRLTEELAKRFQNCRLHIIENAGHYSLPIRNIETILADLIAV